MPPSPPSGRRLPVEYALALGAVSLALAARWLLSPVIGESAVPFVTVTAVLLPLILLVRPGAFLLAALVGGFGALVLFVRPRFSLGAADAADFLELLLFGLASIAAAFAAWLSRRVQTQRAESELELARRSEEVRLVTDAMPALISHVGSDQRYRFVNARYVEWFGHPADEIVGRDMRDVLGDEAFERARPYAEAALAGRRSRYEVELPYRYGGTRRVVAEYVPRVRADGMVDGFFALVSDVTEQRRAEAAQARLAAIVETSGDAITSIGLDGTFLTWNAGAERLFGYEPAEAIGRKLDLIVPPEHTAEERETLERVGVGEVVGPYDTVRRAKDGRRVEVSVTVSPIRDASGAVVGASKVDRNITDRLAAERALRESEQELQTARARERSYLDHLPVGVWFADERGELVYANQAGRRIWGGVRMVGPEDYEQYEVYRHGTDQRIGSEEWALYRAVRGGEASLGEVIDIRAFDGARRTLLNSAVPVRDEEGEIVGGVVMNLDITELKNAEAALRESDRRKDEFLATLAHELRNPLAAVSSATELLANGSALTTEQLARTAGAVQRQVATMVRLVDDLLDVSRISRGTLELRPERTELLHLVEEAVTAARPWIEAKGHSLVVSRPAEPLDIDGDSVRLIQVLSNLLSNACDYTEEGGRIEVRVEKDGAEAVVEIQDTGIGIPEEQLDSIFEMFTRLEAPGTGQTGLGIGLTLSRQLVEMHGGTLRAASGGPGRGSTFAVRLPMAAPCREDPASAQSSGDTEGAESPKARRILVVDDNVDGADMLAMLLTAHGHDVRTAYDGKGALALAAAFAPEVILLDLGLPDLDGMEVCRTVRAERWGVDVLIVAVSGWGQDEDKRRTAEAGFDAHLTKPARIEEVTRVLASTERMFPR
jgi:two-component system, chemotaxis family, CheB/CheR fusion protein